MPAVRTVINTRASKTTEYRTIAITVLFPEGTFEPQSAAEVRFRITCNHAQSNQTAKRKVVYFIYVCNVYFIQHFVAVIILLNFTEKNTHIFKLVSPKESKT